MIPVAEYSRSRHYFQKKCHDEGLQFQLSLGYTRRKLGECGINLNVCSSTHFLGEATSCVLACPTEGFIDIWISAKQVIQLANELDVLVSEAATASVLHEVGHIEQWRQAAKGLGSKPQNDWECEFEAYSLGEMYAVALNGREVNSSYRLIRDYLLGDRPRTQAKSAKSVSATSTPQQTSIAQELERLKATLLDIQAEEIKRSTKAATAAKKTPQKPFLMAPTGSHALEQYHPNIRVGGSVGCFG